VLILIYKEYLITGKTPPKEKALSQQPPNSTKKHTNHPLLAGVTLYASFWAAQAPLISRMGRISLFSKGAYSSSGDWISLLPARGRLLEISGSLGLKRRQHPFFIIYI
jgi:hypothetical protein